MKMLNVGIGLEPRTNRELNSGDKPIAYTVSLGFFLLTDGILHINVLFIGNDCPPLAVPRYFVRL